MFAFKKFEDNSVYLDLWFVNSNNSSTAPVADSCEHGNEPSGSIKDRKFPDKPSHY